MNRETLLFRQISPSWIKNGRVTSQAFKPTPKDEQKLSVYDGDQITAESAWRHFINQGLKSDGVLAVAKFECLDNGLAVSSDSGTFPEHVLIDFSGLTASGVKKVAEKLKRHANERGWQFQP